MHCVTPCVTASATPSPSTPLSPLSATHLLSRIPMKSEVGPSGGAELVETPLYPLPLQLGKEFIPPRIYLRQVLKSLLATLEEACAADPSAEVLDELYGLYTAFLATPGNTGTSEDRRRLESLPGVCSSTCAEGGATASGRQDEESQSAEAQDEGSSAGLGALSWVCEFCAVAPEHRLSSLPGAACTEFCYKTFKLLLPEQVSQPSLATSSDTFTAAVSGSDKLAGLSLEAERERSLAAGPEAADLPGHADSCASGEGGMGLGRMSA